MGVQIRLEKNLTDAERRTLFEWGQDIFGVADKLYQWRPKDWHFIVEENGRVVSHVGVIPAPTKKGTRRPNCLASKPPRRPPSGSIPPTISQNTPFTRPNSSAGMSSWRRVADTRNRQCGGPRSSCVTSFRWSSVCSSASRVSLLSTRGKAGNCWKRGWSSNNLPARSSLLSEAWLYRTTAVNGRLGKLTLAGCPGEFLRFVLLREIRVISWTV